jgi:hypothetical protein
MSNIMLCAVQHTLYCVFKDFSCDENVGLPNLLESSKVAMNGQYMPRKCCV